MHINRFNRFFYSSIRRLVTRCSAMMVNEEPVTRVEANYEATVTTGLEGIARDEIKQKFNVDATVEMGRIWFRTDADIASLLKLRTINNLFVVIHDQRLEADEMPVDKESLQSLLMDVGHKCDWRVGIAKWREKSGFRSGLDVIMKRDVKLREKQPKFRVSSNRYGREHKFTSPEICTMFGNAVDTIFGWPIKMKDYDLEVYANFSHNHLYICITLTPDCLALRNIKVTGISTLRAVYCYAMLRLAKVQAGEIVLDPMAGTGAIPVESQAMWLNDELCAYSLAGELNKTTLNKCSVNMNMRDDESGRRAPGDTLQLDVTKLPFRDESIDVLVSDLPFGRRHGSKKGNKILYPALLNEMARVARPGTGRAVLLTQDTHAIRLAHDANRDLWHEKMYSYVKVGNLLCHFHLFQRNETKYQHERHHQLRLQQSKVPAGTRDKRRAIRDSTIRDDNKGAGLASSPIESS